ncbi:beta-glucuronosyltransferase GlcAT14A-like [Silene latifolia]|uniref:beta-glucuronosyltransferase GlcAT14A-like n=1 Tax=Silene latifolia TaxID=37657 RepID=UPI003D76BAD2
MAMRKNVNPHSNRMFSDRKWLIPFITSLFVSLTLVLAALFGVYSPNYDEDAASQLDALAISESQQQQQHTDTYYVEDDINRSLDSTRNSNHDPPRFAYLISGTKGDSHRIMRVLQAVYHPRNQYVLHMDFESPPRERLDLTMSVKGDPTFRQVENVRVMDKSNLVTYKGPTMVASTLQAISILLRESLNWDWFINLSASDYPLMTQDDILHVFSNLSRNLNFIEHMPMVAGWKLNQRARPIVVDPGLYLSKKYDLAHTTQRRSLPTAFNLFTGSAWAVLTRSFVEYCIWGWDNFPRTALLYFTNFISSPEGYFHTVICNTENFRNTAIGHDLHYIAWDSPPKQHPRVLSMKDFDKMVKSGALFARKFARDDLVLDKIDRELLNRTNRFALGAWCTGSSSNGADPCLLRGNYSVFSPGPGVARLEKLMNTLLSTEFRNKQCSSSQ